MSPVIPSAARARPAPFSLDREVVLALRRGRRGKTPPGAHKWMTAYQILNRLPKRVRVYLQTNVARAGKGAGWFQSAATAVARACERVEKATGEIEKSLVYFDTTGVLFAVKDQRSPVEAGFGVCGIYRATR
jgi:hypothetical protein